MPPPPCPAAQAAAPSPPCLQLAAQRLLRQYLYFFASRASNLSTWPHSVRPLLSLCLLLGSSAWVCWQRLPLLLMALEVLVYEALSYECMRP